MSLDDLLPLVSVGCLLAVLGQGLNESPPPWKWWKKTLWLHPVLGGAAVGLLFRSLPVPAAMGAGLAGRALWYAMAGILAVPLYEAAQAWLRRRIDP